MKIFIVSILVAQVFSSNPTHTFECSPGATMAECEKEAEMYKLARMGQAQNQTRSTAITTNYGCWCRNRVDFGILKGAPVDELDSACRQYMLGQRCIQMDFGGACDQINANHAGNIAASCAMVNGNVVCTFSCTSSNNQVTNPGNQPLLEQGCNEDLCKLEIQAWNEQDAAKIDFGVSQAFKLTAGFDVAIGCDSNGGPKNEPFDSCCGSYPKRLPYFSGSTSKECCNDLKFLNPTISICCPNGEVKDIGTC